MSSLPPPTPVSSCHLMSSFGRPPPPPPPLQVMTSFMNSPLQKRKEQVETHTQIHTYMYTRKHTCIQAIHKHTLFRVSHPINYLKSPASQKWQSLHFLGNASTIRKQLIVSLGCIDQVVHHQKQVNGGYLGRVEPLEAPNLERRALRTSAASYITLSLHDHPPTILTACASFCDLDSLRQLLHC